MRIWLYIFAIIFSLAVILALVNIPDIAREMINTLAAVSWREALCCILGLVTGTGATYLAMRKK